MTAFSDETGRDSIAQLLRELCAVIEGLRPLPLVIDGAAKGLTNKAERVAVALFASPVAQEPVATKKVYIKPLRTIVEIQTAYADQIRDWLNTSPPATPSLKWHDILKEAAPKDRPVFLLSIQSQENGGFYITGDVAKWDKNSQCFIHGLSFYSGIGNMIATHWCELSDMDLPINPDTKY